jgi:hypothetical protein
MTHIRELLREATEDLPVNLADPVRLLRRAATRRRRKLATIGCVVVAVLVAIIVPLLLWNGPGSATLVAPKPTPVTHHGAVVQNWAPDDGEVAAGFGSIWGMQCCGGSTKPSWVDRLDPTTGQRLAHIDLPGPTTTIAVGAGYVWTIGATDGGPSSISAIDPVTSHVITMPLPNPKAEPYNIAFAHGSAWVTMQLLNQVWRLTPTASDGFGNNPTFERSIVEVSGGPTSIATTGDGALWVQQEDTN